MEDTVCYLPQVTAVDQFLCNAGIQTHVFPHMQSAMWKKWMLNVGLNQISALTGATYGDFTRLPEVMELAKSAMREVVHIAQAASVHYPMRILKRFRPSSPRCCPMERPPCCKILRQGGAQNSNPLRAPCLSSAANMGWIRPSIICSTG